MRFNYVYIYIWLNRYHSDDYYALSVFSFLNVVLNLACDYCFLYIYCESEMFDVFGLPVFGVVDDLDCCLVIYHVTADENPANNKVIIKKWKTKFCLYKLPLNFLRYPHWKLNHY